MHDEKTRLQVSLAHYEIVSISPTKIVTKESGATLEIDVIEIELTLAVTLDQNTNETKTTKDIRFYFSYDDNALVLGLINGYFVVEGSGNDFDALRELLNAIDGITPEEGDGLISKAHALANELAASVLRVLKKQGEHDQLKVAYDTIQS